MAFRFAHWLLSETRVLPRKENRGQQRQQRPSLERLETREVPALLLVTNGNNSGPGSLRQAIIDSNVTVPEWDEIRIMPGIPTIPLLSELPNIGGDVDINGPAGGPATLITRASAEPFRIFTMAPNGIIVTLRRLEITGGAAYDGGAIWAMANLTLEDCVVISNTAGNNGGGIFHTLAPLTLTRTQVYGNSAGNSGGGIYSVSQGGLQTVTIHQSSIDSNTAVIDGGGIYYDANGILQITDSLVQYNEALQGNGGGIYCLNCAELFVSASEPFWGIYYNTAFMGSGGGIYVACVSLRLHVDTFVAGNFAANMATRGMFAAKWVTATVYIGPFFNDPYVIEDC